MKNEEIRDTLRRFGQIGTEQALDQLGDVGTTAHKEATSTLTLTVDANTGSANGSPALHDHEELRVDVRLSVRRKRRPAPPPPCGCSCGCGDNCRDGCACAPDCGCSCTCRNRRNRFTMWALLIFFCFLFICAAVLGVFTPKSGPTSVSTGSGITTYVGGAQQNSTTQLPWSIPPYSTPQPPPGWRP